MSVFDTVVRLIYLAAAVGFVLGLHLMNSPATARSGNRLSAAGMLVAVHRGTVRHAGDRHETAGGAR